MKKVLGIVGPTGIGKTSLGIEICQELNGEIISCDSRQIYRRLDIGTAKPTPEEKVRVRHHLIDIISIDEDFSAFRYREMALDVIEDILKRGKQPVVVGGTGFYYRALSEGIFETPEHDEDYRQELEEIAEKEGNEFLWNQLRTVDPISTEKISKSDRFRIIRALEIYKSTGEAKSSHAKSGNYPVNKYDFTTYGLTFERKLLYDRIDLRVEKMLEDGWYEETEKLIKESKLNANNVVKLMGYNILYECITKQRELSEGIEKIKQAHRNYAKRQLTWFRGQMDIGWFSPDDPQILEKICEPFKLQ